MSKRQLFKTDQLWETDWNNESKIFWPTIMPSVSLKRWIERDDTQKQRVDFN